ncbi:gliding motility-associated-like protein [Kordia periserrulae]|uniref:Gliding motility-associated-like protein n=1 Tax=Kordia periserrulae TaxID=701523 RepID=A0A2T6C207_9FLAO|nr:T9SS type B sorting domain-containing protein [Kordia periserrulae]PTX62277.1 gliding motility-associated-like protein [Kordia periserrulae]
MKKYYKLIYCVLLCGLHTMLGQNEGNNWYFGTNAGLDFSTTPPTASLNGALTTNEGVATISDGSGQLLFYTDGSTVYDKNHQITPNGTGLTGNNSSTQSAVIVPKPGNPLIYYIFTVDEGAGPDGLRYSEFDLSLNNGNGDVTTLKNVLLSTPTTEKITAVQKTNGTDFWVLSHSWQNDTFLIYEVTAAGVNETAITQNIGSVHSGGSAESIGYFKASSNGERLAIAQWGSNSFVELFDFNADTGVISNPIKLENVFFNGSGSGAYGVEFSPDVQLLYVSDLNFDDPSSPDNGRVHQFDLTAGNATDIINSDVIVYQGGDFIGAIQIANDERLYLANSGSQFVDVIENPNVVGTGATYVIDAIDLQGRTCRLGLPTFIQSFFGATIQLENFCLGDVTNFSLNTTEPPVSVNWDFGDGTTSTSLAPSHTYASVGTYTVSADINFGTEIRQTSKEVTIYEIPVASAVSDFLLCDDSTNNEIESFDLSTKITEILGSQSNLTYDVAFYTSLEDAENDLNRLPLTYSNTTNNQEIFARIYNLGQGNCFDITSFMLIVNPFPLANTVADIDICDDQSNDGSEMVNLNQFNSEVLLNQTAEDFEITYHLTQDDADNDISALPTNFQTLDNPQPLFVRIEAVGNPLCFDTTNFEINITPAIIANEINDLFECSFLDDANAATFNLASQNDDIINGLTGNYEITFHLSEQNAMMDVESISSTFTNTTNPQQIYARVEDTTNASCFDIVDFQITALATPIINETETVYLCTDGTVMLSADVTADFYNWSTNEITESIVVDTPGTYTVDIGNSYTALGEQINCSNTKTFTVIESGPTLSIDVSITDWTNFQNTILVTAEGLGDYEYSLDGINYTDDNFFENLLSGEYTVYVRDKNGCGVVTEPAYLLNYPRFFTPNNDGINDNWQIIAAASDPTLQIFIFDRYGKRLTTLNPTTEGWNGNYNGRPMPSGDYWFKVERPMTGNVYTGHFTLKR